MSNGADRPEGRGGVPDPLHRAKETVAETLLHLRTEAKLSQKEAAERAGISQGHWCKLENGKNLPNVGQLLRIQGLFGLDSVESFFGPSPSGRLARALKGPDEPTG